MELGTAHVPGLGMYKSHSQNFFFFEVKGEKFSIGVSVSSEERVVRVDMFTVSISVGIF